MKLKLTSWNATDIFINKMPSEEDKLIFQPLIELLQQTDPEPVLTQWDALALSWFTVCLFVCFNRLVLFASVLANLLHSHLSPSHYRRAWVSVRRTSSCSMGRCCFVLIHSRGTFETRRDQLLSLGPLLSLSLVCNFRERGNTQNVTSRGVLHSDEMYCILGDSER